MPSNGKSVSIKELIGEIYRDKFYSYQLPYTDAIQWAVESIQLIGAPQALANDIKRITISNYRGMLPCSFDTLTQAAGSYDGCTLFPMRGNTNTFGAVFSCEPQLLTTLINELNSTTAEEPIGEDISGNPVYTFQNGNMSMPETTSDTNNISTIGDATYELNDNYIFTNFESGYVFLAFKALPVDGEGFPTIPDNRRFKEAVKAFICYKIDYILWRKGELSKDIFEFSEKEWLFYVNSASNAIKMPNYDQMQSILNSIKLIPQKYSHNNFFKHLGS